MPLRLLSIGILIASLAAPVGASAISINCPNRVCHSYDRNGSCNNYTCIGTDYRYGSTGYPNQYYRVNYYADRCNRTNRYYDSSFSSQYYDSSFSSSSCRSNSDGRYSDPSRYYDYTSYNDYLRYNDNRYADLSNYDTNDDNRQACVRRCNSQYSSSYYYRQSACNCVY